MTTTCDFITVRDLETWTTVKAMGTFEGYCFTGEIYSFNGKRYYCSYDELDEKTKAEVVDYYDSEDFD